MTDNLINMTASTMDAGTYSWNGWTDNSSMIDGITTNLSTDISNTTAAPAVGLPPYVIQARIICYTYIGPIICAFGILCNIINLLVLSQKQLKESPYTYLTGLAMTDFGALFFSFIFLAISHKYHGVYFWRFYEAHIFLPLTNVCTTSSVWIIVLLTIERFLFVSHPLWAKATCDRASAKLKIAIIIVVALIFNIPRFMVFKVDKVDGVHIIGATDFRRGEFFHIVTWVYAFVIQIIPLLILCFSNIYLVIAVMRARQQREILQIRNNKEAAWHSEQVRLTITLISIVFLFIICILPSAVSDFPIAFNLFGKGQTENQFRSSEFYLMLQYVANVLVWCNLSLNFVLYCAFNEKFRRVMRCMLHRWFKCLHWHRKDGSVLLLVNFKSGQSIHRNSSNSITLQTKVSTTAAPDVVKLNGKSSDHALNNQSVSTALFEKTDQSDKEEEAE